MRFQALFIFIVGISTGTTVQAAVIKGIISPSRHAEGKSLLDIKRDATFTSEDFDRIVGSRLDELKETRVVAGDLALRGNLEALSEIAWRFEEFNSAAVLAAVSEPKRVEIRRETEQYLGDLRLFTPHGHLLSPKQLVTLEGMIRGMETALKRHDGMDLEDVPAAAE